MHFRFYFNFTHIWSGSIAHNLVSLVYSYLWKPFYFVFPFISSQKCEYTSPDLSSSRFEEEIKNFVAIVAQMHANQTERLIHYAHGLHNSHFSFVWETKKRDRNKRRMRDAHTNFAPLTRSYLEQFFVPISWCAIDCLVHEIMCCFVSQRRKKLP